MIANPHTPPLPGALEVTISGSPIWLLRENAAYEPASDTILVADLHLGKAETFRRAGLPVPEGVNQSTLVRLADLLNRLPSARLAVLGDLMHGPLPRTHPVFDQIESVLGTYAARIDVVAGNHDRQASEYAELMGVRVVEDAYLAGPFALRHEPHELTERHVIAGHIHPVVRLHGRADSLRTPCFWVRERVTVLPAFGSFTGGWSVRPQANESLFISDGNRVARLPLSVMRKRAVHG